MANDGLTTCPACGRPESAWEGRFCGRCETRYQAEEEARLRLVYERVRKTHEGPLPSFWEWVHEKERP